MGQSRGGPSGGGVGSEAPPLPLLCLQGEVVPHDPGGAGRQPAVQREHHLRAAGVSASAGLPRPRDPDRAHAHPGSPRR